MKGHFLTIGKIVNVRGLKGEVKVISTTDFPKSRFKKGNVVFFYDGSNDNRLELVIDTVSTHKGFFYLKFIGISQVESAEKLVNGYLQVQKKDSFLEQGSYYYDDLENCNVFDEGKTFIGVVKKVEAYSSQQTLRVKREGQKDVLIPFVEAFIKDVSIADKAITIHVIDGLL